MSDPFSTLVAGASVLAAASAHGAESGVPGFLQPSALTAVATWVTFGIVVAVLHKYAWKPILSGLDAREARIRQSIEDADKVQKELTSIEEIKRTELAKADDEAKEIIAQARKGAVAAAHAIEAKTNDEVKILYENADRDIEAMKRKQVANLKRENAAMVLDLAGRLVDENLDDEKNRALTDKLLAEF